MGQAAHLEIIRDRNAYFVRNGSTILHGPACYQRAEEAMERLAREAKLRTRKCMTCKDSFMSEGPHNRMCQPCRSLSAYDGSA